jgi:hypothetical protein
MPSLSGVVGDCIVFANSKEFSMRSFGGVG